MTQSYHKKVVLGVYGRRTKWAPFWAVIRAFGKGKRAHPSQLTAVRRSWRRTKLRIKPRIARRTHLG